MGQHELKLKVDTGSSENTRPLRTIQQMYEKERWKQLIQPNNATLTAYNGSQIKYIGQLNLMCSNDRTDWFKTTFYVVDVQEGPSEGKQ